MSSPNPSQELQVVGPGEVAPAAPQAPQTATPAAPVTAPALPASGPSEITQPDHVDSGPAEDRILSPEETKNLFNYGSLEAPAPEPTPAQISEAEQVAALMAADQQPAIAPQAPAAPAPGQPTPAQLDLSVQQTLQQVPQAPVQPGAQPPQVSQPAVAPAPGAPQVAPVVTGPLPVQPGAPLAQPVAQPSPQEAALAAQVQQLTRQVTGLSGQIQQQQAAPPAPAAPGTQPQVPQFNMQIPQQHMTALGSENPAEATTAMNSIINGVAQVVYQQAMRDVDQRFESYTPMVDQRVQAANVQGDIKRDMYGTYPELSGMEGQVAAVAEQMQQSGQTNGQWSADLRDSIAERLSPLVPGLAQKVQQNRNARYGQQMGPQFPNQVQQVPQAVPYNPQVPQLLPQVQPQVLPPGVQPVQIQGGAHVPMAPQQGPVYVRDAHGNITQVHPQQYQLPAGPQARPGGQNQVDSDLQDIWNTLGYTNPR